ncbi:MAG: (5-formylfuran-3-yl)methyl phosphate synthase [Burkholderiales bacterium]
MLASVTCVQEAVMALEAGADIIDLKDPSQGALGALKTEIARDIVEAVGTLGVTSATVGDFPAMVPAEVVAGAQRTAKLGVSYVKVGFWGSANDAACASALSPLCAATRVVAVLFADLPYDPKLIDVLYQSGFTGVMLDTAKKDGAPLRLLKTELELALFVRRVQGLGMLAGLAGKLRLPDVAPLLSLRPDYLGFRGALCAAGARTNQLDPSALAGIRDAVSAVPRSKLSSAGNFRAKVNR